MRFISALAALLVVVTACGEAARPPAQAPAPPPSTASATTTKHPSITTSTTSTTGVTAAPAPARPADARVLYDRIAAATGWRIPAVAEPDFAADLCQRAEWGDDVLYPYAESLLMDEFLAWGAELNDENLLKAVQLAWALGASQCPEHFPGTRPTELPGPRCDLAGWLPQRPPWSDVVPPPTESTLVHGVSRLTWTGEDGGRYEVTLGRDTGHVRGDADGVVDGFPATVVIDDGAVAVHWERSPHFCGAWTVLISPVPDVPDVAAYVDELTIWRPTLNPAEQAMRAALDRLTGYREGGGEPAHGGPDAVYVLETSGDALIGLYATPLDSVPDFYSTGGEARGVDTIAGVGVTFERTDDGWYRASFDDGEFFVSADTNGGLETLITFMEAWVPAWAG